MKTQSALHRTDTMHSVLICKYRSDWYEQYSMSIPNLVITLSPAILETYVLRFNKGFVDSLYLAYVALCKMYLEVTSAVL